MPAAAIEIVLSIVAVLGSLGSLFLKFFGTKETLKVREKGSDKWVEISDLSDEKDFKKLIKTH